MIDCGIKAYEQPFKQSWFEDFRDRLSGWFTKLPGVRFYVAIRTKRAWALIKRFNEAVSNNAAKPAWWWN